MSLVHHGPPVYVNADKSAVVDGASPEAAFLLVGTNGVVKGQFVDLYRKHFGLDGSPEPELETERTVTYGGTEPEQDDKPEPEPVEEPAVEPEPVPEPEPAATTKPRKRTARKP